MSEPQINNPLHGVTLGQIMESLVDHYGWTELGKRINIRCFNSNPSIKSSLTFLRKTPWARSKVEKLYIAMQKGRSQKAGKVSITVSKSQSIPRPDRSRTLGP